MNTSTTYNRDAVYSVLQDYLDSRPRAQAYRFALRVCAWKSGTLNLLRAARFAVQTERYSPLAQFWVGSLMSPYGSRGALVQQVLDKVEAGEASPDRLRSAYDSAVLALRARTNHPFRPNLPL